MAARLEVSKEYVRQQLYDMGVRELSEEELESYTNDFARLISEHLQQETPAETSSGESFTSTDSSQLQDHTLKETTPPTHSYQRYPAIFKSFPGDKEGRVHPHPTSLTPSPTKTTFAAPHPPTAPLERGESVRERVGLEREKPNVVVRKRKVLRKVNGVSRVFDESYTSVVASPSVGSVASDLSHLSLTSVSSSSDSASSSSSSCGVEDHTTRWQRPQCKSFIRPATAQLCPRRFKKHDPVARYHYWKEVWQNEKFPGEENRSSLRWQIREQMLQQDLPLFVPPRRKVKVNNYVVPTDKKRTALRWEIRHQMAEQL